MRRLAALATVPLLAAACARTGAGDSPASPSSAAASSRDAEIYAAVLRRYLTTPGDNSNLRFRTAFILDHADTTAADPMRTGGSDTAVTIAPADQRGIATALRDVTTVRFVSSRATVVEDDAGCATVRDNGILILLAPPKAAGSQFHVGINGFVACLGATWLTYVVTRGSDGWAVTGTTGPVAIS